ncbi:MAG: hypothetical protein JW384_03227 [Nitrosomonadaceae bacterium]|nr:hypothetical protein [Nitrosomonadaceae bacterium]
MTNPPALISSLRRRGFSRRSLLTCGVAWEGGGVAAEGRFFPARAAGVGRAGCPKGGSAPCSCAGVMATA